MRNKEHFLKDIKAVTKEVLVAEVDFVEDAAHTLNNDTDNHGEYTILSSQGRFGINSNSAVGPGQTFGSEFTGDFTTTGKNETFIFTRNERPKTDNPDEKIEDWFYEGRK